jgi:hypothetical protein
VAAAKSLELWISNSLRKLKGLKAETILNRRWERLRNLGSFFSSSKGTPTAPVVKPRRRRKLSKDETATVAASIES